VRPAGLVREQHQHLDPLVPASRYFARSAIIDHRFDLALPP
jgi:hypothetical protein